MGCWGASGSPNLAWLRQTGRRYIIGAPKSELKKFAADLARPLGWRTVQEGVEVKLTRHPETGETVILCRSADRRIKERAIHERFSRRIDLALDRLSARIARSKKRLDPAVVNRQIGRILQRNQRAAARFTITLEPDGTPAGCRLRIEYNAAFDDWAEVSEGAYLLRSNIDDWSDQQLWKAYIQLTQAEAAFRIQKNQLNVRPIWHQREDRVQAHILVCFLAFVLWKAWRCGSSAQAWVIHRGRSSRNLPAFNRTMSCCPPQHMASFDSVASLSPTPPKPRFSTASVSPYPSGCGLPNPSGDPSL